MDRLARALALFFRTIPEGFCRVVGGTGRPSVVVPRQRLASEVQCIEDIAPRTQEILAAPIARRLRFDGPRESDRHSWKQTPLKRVESFTPSLRAHLSSALPSRP